MQARRASEAFLPVGRKKGRESETENIPPCRKEGRKEKEEEGRKKRRKKGRKEGQTDRKRLCHPLDLILFLVINGTRFRGWPGAWI
jgi:hypothetical protein